MMFRPRDFIASATLGLPAASFVFVVLGVAVLIPAIPAAHAQGVRVSGRSAVPKRPLPPGLAPPKLDYRDIAASAGLTGVNVSGDEKRKTYIVEAAGTGVALIDYDKDGLLDIFLVNADRLEETGKQTTHYLYRNLGGLKFEDVTRKSGLVHTGWGQGVCAGDVDNDGFTDLVVTHWGDDILFRNRGDGTFAAETIGDQQAGERRWSTGCAFLDFDRDGDLDLFTAHYIEFDRSRTPKPGENAECRWKGVPVLCGPMGLPGETMSLHENDGKGVFRDISAAAGVSGPKEYYGFTPLTGDFDNDGWPDIYVACDSTPSLLYRNRGDGTFEELGVISGTAYNMDGGEQAGMGAAAGDFDGDGDLDIFKTNFSTDLHTLYRNDGDWIFSDETLSTGLGVHSSYVGWGTAFLDIDHDGWKDIFVANGHVYPSIDAAGAGETFHQPRLMYWNRGDGKFHDVSDEAGPGISAEHSSRGVAVGDLDNDGDLEIVVVNMHEAPSLLRNFESGGNSLLVQALAPSGRDAVGARVAVESDGRTQVDEVRSGGYHISQSDFRVHFGLAEATSVAVSIRWPDGKVDAFEDVKANQWVVIQQGKGIVDRRPFGE